VLPDNYRIRKFPPHNLFGDALADPTLGGITDQEIIVGGTYGTPHLVGPNFAVGRFGGQGCCRTLSCQIRRAFEGEFNITAAEQAAQTIHAPSGMTWEEFYNWEVGLLVHAIQSFPIPEPVIPAGLDDDFAIGEQIFEEIGCTDCHRNNYPGGFAPYTDYRLHVKRGEGKGIALCGNLKGNEVMTPSLISRRNFLGRDMNTNPSIKQDAVRMLHNIEDAKDSVEQYLQLSDPDRADLDLFLELL
jgi:hypothetical protein